VANGDGSELEDARARLHALLAKRKPGPIAPALLLREARIKTAETKILRVLRQQTVCHQKELERRVCEVGFRFYPLAPQAERPEPVHLVEARKRLSKRDLIDLQARTVRGNKYFFYHLADADPAAVRLALDAKLRATQAFELAHSSKAYSGYATEHMLWRSMGAAENWFVMPHEPGRDIRALDGKTSDVGVDLAGVELETRVRAVVEVKNIREWVYPDGPVVWTLLSAAAQLDAVPVLIASRIAEPTFLFMLALGGYAVPMLNVYLDQAVLTDPPIAGQLRAGIDLLGYKDVKFVDPELPVERFTKHFSERLPGRLPDMWTTFSGVKDEALRLARDECLREDGVRAGKVSGRSREDLFNEFWRQVKGGEATALHPSEF
jgi:hypothetical protein